MNGLLVRVLPIGRDERLRRLADEIANQCHEALWPGLGTQALAMSQAEAQGYIRVRARNLVCRHIEQALGNGNKLSARQHRQLTELTLERILARMTEQLVAAQAQPTSCVGVA